MSDKWKYRLRLFLIYYFGASLATLLHGPVFILAFFTLGIGMVLGPPLVLESIFYAHIWFVPGIVSGLAFLIALAVFLNRNWMAKWFVHLGFSFIATLSCIVLFSILVDLRVKAHFKSVEKLGFEITKENTFLNQIVNYQLKMCGGCETGASQPYAFATLNECKWVWSFHKGGFIDSYNGNGSNREICTDKSPFELLNSDSK